MNKVILIGNLTKDPEGGETSSGIPYSRLYIAVNCPFTDENGERQADFFNVTVWRAQAQNCLKYLCKGKKVCVVGRLQNRTYEDKDGNKRMATDIIAEEVEFLSPSDNSSGAEKTPVRAKAEPQKPKLEEVQEEDLPF
nr:MAG TPA: Single strand binding protein [Caudoviricetes sp.]